jgi:hypothetical protein
VLFGDERDDHLIGALQYAFGEQTGGILKRVAQDRAAAIAKIEERFARIEGQLTAMTSFLGVAQSKLGDLRGEQGEKGERGQPGKRGPKGERGVDGKDGAPNFDPQGLALRGRMSDGTLGPEIALAHVLAGVSIDQKNYAINFKLLDGTELAFSVRALFEQFDRELRGY